jgi:hypothetical protein
MAAELGWSHARYSRFERGAVAATITPAHAGAALGIDLAAGFRPSGEPIRDAGQQALGKRLHVLLAPAWKVTAEVLLPKAGDRRYWWEGRPIPGSGVILL